MNVMKRLYEKELESVVKVLKKKKKKIIIRLVKVF